MSRHTCFAVMVRHQHDTSKLFDHILTGGCEAGWEGGLSVQALLSPLTLPIPPSARFA